MARRIPDFAAEYRWHDERLLGLDAGTPHRRAPKMLGLQEAAHDEALRDLERWAERAGMFAQRAAQLEMTRSSSAFGRLGDMVAWVRRTYIREIHEQDTVRARRALAEETAAG